MIFPWFLYGSSCYFIIRFNNPFTDDQFSSLFYVRVFLAEILYIDKFNKISFIVCSQCKRKWPFWFHIYIYIYIYIYIGSISSLIQISLNIKDILCLHISFWIRSNSRITFIVFGGNLIYVLSIVVCIPSTFCPTMGHHQEKQLFNLRCCTCRVAWNFQFPQCFDCF